MSKNLTAVGKCQEIDQNSGKCWGKFYHGRLLITNFRFGAVRVCSTLCTCVYYTVECHVGNHNLGRTAVKSWENVREMLLNVRVCGEWLLYI